MARLVRGGLFPQVKTDEASEAHVKAAPLEE